MLCNIVIQSIYTTHILHSIAFKPAESGWGGSKKYSQNFDSIFNNKNKFRNDSIENKKSNEEEKTIRERTAEIEEKKEKAT